MSKAHGGQVLAGGWFSWKAKKIYQTPMVLCTTQNQLLWLACYLTVKFTPILLLYEKFSLKVSLKANRIAFSKRILQWTMHSAVLRSSETFNKK